MTVCVLQADTETVRREAMEAVVETLKQQRCFEEALIQMYPHGVPKYVQKRLQAEGVLSTQLPGLGFGCVSSMSDKMAAASLR